MAHAAVAASLGSVCQHQTAVCSSKSKCKCLYWQREWGNVPKAITEAIAAAASKGKK